MRDGHFKVLLDANGRPDDNTSHQPSITTIGLKADPSFVTCDLSFGRKRGLLSTFRSLWILCGICVRNPPLNMADPAESMAGNCPRTL
jgi:hypothetical protein